MWNRNGNVQTRPVKRTLFGALTAVIGMFTFGLMTVASAPPVAAQAFCGDRVQVLESLSNTYSEKSVAMGLASSGGVLEVLASPDGSWTILITHPSGVSCVMAAGENWESLPQVTAGMDS